MTDGQLDQIVEDHGQEVRAVACEKFATLEGQPPAPELQVLIRSATATCCSEATNTVSTGFAYSARSKWYSDRQREQFKMPETTKIAWTDATWNPPSEDVQVSPRCVGG